MSRLIDADKLIESMNDRYNEKVNNVPDNLAEGFMQMEKLIKEQPTAYNVDKVVEQLEEEAFDMWICEEQFDMNSPYFKDVLYKVVKLCEAIDVVKAGGIDE